MDFYIISAIVNAITSLVLGLLVLSQGKTKKINILFFLFTLAIVFWSLSYFFWQISITAAQALSWSRILMVGAIFIPVLYFHFIVIFLNIKNNFLVYLAYILAFVFLFLDFTSYFVVDVSQKLDFKFWPSAGPAYSVFLLIWLFYTVYTVYLLYRGFSAEKGIKRKQLMYILIGTIIGYAGGATNYFLWYNILIPPIGNVLESVYVLLVAFAILRYHMFNIKVIATELFIFAVWIAILVEVFTAETATKIMFEAGLLVVVVSFGVLIIKSVTKEIETREEIEKLAKKLKTANNRLRELDQQKSEFVSIASHQLRSPLTAIKGYASMILDGSFGDIAEEIKSPVNKIMESSKRLVYIVEDFLNVTRIEQGRMQYDFVDVDVKELFKDVISNISPTIKESGLDVNFDTDKGLAYVVSADKGKIRQVFSNLLDNAIKYTPSGSVDVKISEDVSAKKIIISVKDSGIGMSKDFINNKIFGKFNRGGNARDLHTDGSGVGLYVASEIVKSHNGKIWVESDGENNGSTFFVEFPAI